MILETLVVGMIQANCYIVGDEKTKKAIVVDPGGDGHRIVKKLDELDLECVAILATHGHFDHVAALAEVKEATGAPIMMHKEDLFLVEGMVAQGQLFGVNVQPAPSPDKFLEDGDVIEFGELSAKAIHTPGHSRGSVCFLIGDRVIVGDLLFQGSIGRTDLAGGDYEVLINSVRSRIFTLDGATTVYPGHGPSTTVATEERHNPFFR